MQRTNSERATAHMADRGDGWALKNWNCSTARYTAGGMKPPVMEGSQDMIRDQRCRGIRLGSGADSQIVILGGSEFKITNISQEMYRNFHHFFIDITDRDAKQLRPVLEEPAEVKRRPKVDPDILPPSIRPAGARSVWEPCVQQLMNTISRPVPKKAAGGRDTTTDGYRPHTGV